MRFPLIKQLDGMDCGPACLRMVAAFHGRKFDRERLRDLCSIGKAGVSMLGISEAADRIGLRSISVSIPFTRMRDQAPMPCIVHWEQNHFVVVYKVTKKWVYVADPETGLIRYTIQEFMRGWIPSRPNPTEEDKGLALLMEPTPEFYRGPANESDDAETQRRGISFFFGYLRPHKKLIAQMVVGLLLGLVFSLIFPFMTQAVVDYGIGNLDLNLITVLLIGQVMLVLSETGISFIRGWIMLHMGSRISISLIADFLNKMLKLPTPFFDTRTTGDIMQRIEDHGRINSFLTSNTLDTIFSMLSFFVFAGILAFYNLVILGIFVGFTVFSVIWIALFLKRRRMLDQKTFAIDAKEQDNIVQLVAGVQEIKIQGLEQQKRWEWEAIAAQRYKLSVQKLSMRQTQRVGLVFIGQIRRILISFVAARAVIAGDMTLGMMLATQYIVGQLSSPVQSLMSFMNTAQDAKLSLERMQQIYDQKEEDDYLVNKLQVFPPERTVTLQNLSFSYAGAGAKPVLTDINLQIPEGHVTAIVGPSGSGKTTLMKLLLGIYQPSKGRIYIGRSPLDQFDGRRWRARCGIVMQDGFIFSDTIARNVACDREDIDPARLAGAIHLANLEEFIDGLPLGYETRIGENGQGISGGQRQRILIARSIYKNPEFLLFDEATSSLDASNEHTIMANLNNFSRGRTSIVIAHRLSTVKNAGQIVVLDKGQVVEIGNHNQLVAKRGMYFNLVKNQLELDSADSLPQPTAAF
jgi:ATP-binding cassette subfamily B protein